MPYFSRDSVHWSVRWPHLFVSWHRGVYAMDWIWGYGNGCKGFVLGLPGGSLEVSWGPRERQTGLPNQTRS